MTRRGRGLVSRGTQGSAGGRSPRGPGCAGAALCWGDHAFLRALPSAPWTQRLQPGCGEQALAPLLVPLVLPRASVFGPRASFLPRMQSALRGPQGPPAHPVPWPLAASASRTPGSAPPPGLCCVLDSPQTGCRVGLVVPVSLGSCSCCPLFSACSRREARWYPRSPVVARSTVAWLWCERGGRQGTVTGRPGLISVSWRMWLSLWALGGPGGGQWAR